MMACVQAAVELSESLGMACPLHPTASDVAQMTSWMACKTSGSATTQPERWACAKQAAEPPDSISLSVQLFTTALHGSLRHVPY